MGGLFGRQAILRTSDESAVSRKKNAPHTMGIAQSRSSTSLSSASALKARRRNDRCRRKKIRTKVAKLSSKLRDLQRKDRELENRENLENLLPSELWSLVADKLGDEDLLSLGMSCRYFRGVWREERKVRELPIPELSILIEL